MTRISTRVLFTTAPALLVAGLLSAQNGDKLATVMAENAKRLHQYTYKQRTEVLYKGEDKIVRLNAVRFGPDGQRQATLISQTGGEEATGLGHRIVNKKRAEVKEYVDRLSALIENYLPPDPEKLRKALTTAEIVPAGSALTLTMKGYLKSGDSLALFVDTATRKVKRVDLKTALDKDSISVTAEMASIPDGPDYPGLIKIKVPPKNLEINISASDFVKQ
jgi:hypothetical protein